MTSVFEHAKHKLTRLNAERRLAKGRRIDWSSYQDVGPLCRDHFRYRSTPNHLNRGSMTYALSLLESNPAQIIETGVSCRGTDSTRLFDAYVRSFGGSFESVDLNAQVVSDVQEDLSDRSTVICDDSVVFLGRIAEQNENSPVDFVYLDSYDVDFLNPLPAASHCLDEFFAILPALRPGAIVLIDDSPSEFDLLPPSSDAQKAARDTLVNFGALPGKGMLVESALRAQGVQRLRMGYQALYIVDEPLKLSQPS